MAGRYTYWLICLPLTYPGRLVLLTENDHDGGMIRDYGVPGAAPETRRVPLDEVAGVFRDATKRFSVEPHKTTDYWYWWNEIQRRSVGTCQAPATTLVDHSQSAPGSSKGSKYHIQRWVNEYTEDLQRAIGEAFPALANCRLRWVSPLTCELFREYQDREFLQAIGQDCLESELADFWPTGGPQWDALAVLEGPDVGVVLVEAKAYPEEAENRHCRAAGASLTKISERLDEVKATLGAEMTADWLGSRYQVANRLAHLSFLRAHGVQAWYVQICFCDDLTHRPTTRARWREALPGLWGDLGLSKPPEFVADLLLPARDCDSEKLTSWAASYRVPLTPVQPSDRSSSTPRSILDGTDSIINNALGILSGGRALSWHDKASAHCLGSTPTGDGAVQFVAAVIDRISRNWGGALRGSGQNWRWCPVVDQHVQGGEVGLQKSIVKHCGPQWVNAIPTASGLLPAPCEERQRNIDLGFMRNENECELIELKLADGHQYPLSAAVQLLQYACLYLHARQNAERMATVRNAFLMGVRVVHFQVLSFRPFYTGFELRRLEQTLHDGLSGVAMRQGLTISFQFTHFPESFSWDDSNIVDLQRAANGRVGLYGRLK